MWFKMLCCVFICRSRCIIQFKGSQLWKRYRVKQQFKNFRQGCHLRWRCGDVGPALPHQTVRCGSIQEKNWTKMALLRCTHLQHVDFRKYCKFHLLCQWCVTFEAAVTCLLGPCALTGPLCWVCLCCIIRCTMRWMNDDNSSSLSRPPSLSEEAFVGILFSSCCWTSWTSPPFNLKGETLCLATANRH